MEWILDNIIALVAIVIAAVSLGWQILEARSKYKAKVLIRFGFEIKLSSLNNQFYFDLIKLRIINLKESPVRIRLHSIEYYFLTPDKTAHNKLNSFTKFLEVNSNYEELKSFEEKEINLGETNLRSFNPGSIYNLRIVFIDSTGKKHKSKFHKAWGSSVYNMDKIQGINALHLIDK